MTWAENWQMIWPTAASVFVALLVLLPIFVRDWFELTNRFAGPIMRVRRELRDIANGKQYRPIVTRDGDFWPEIAQELNAAVATLSASKVTEEVDIELPVK